MVHYASRHLFIEDKMSIITTTEARANLFKLVEQINTSHEPVHIKGKKHSAVIISEDDYNSLQETLYINSIKGLAQSIIKARNEPLEEYSDTLNW